VATATVEFKRGYFIRKCAYELGGKKSKFTVVLLGLKCS